MVFEAPTRHSIIWDNVVWSPDGQFIAVATTIEDDVFPQRDTSVYIIALDGSDPQLIYRASEPRDIEAVSWSPDSSALALIQSVLDPRADYYYSLRSEIGVVTRDAAPLRVLFSSEQYLISSLAWSPDSRQLAYSIWMHDGRLETRASEGIYRVDVDGAEPVQVTSGWDTLGVWSPDGDYLFFRRAFETNRSSIFRTRPDGSYAKPITPPYHNLGLPQWSPNRGMMVFFADNVSRPVFSPFEGLYVLGSDGLGPEQIVDAIILGPLWSPSGRQIAVGYITQTGQARPCREVLVVMNADGSGATPLTGELDCFTLLAWVP
jgi:Tol biopolymer transport system component